jgi:hypothetical protein
MILKSSIIFKIQTALPAVYFATNATIKEMITKQKIIAEEFSIVEKLSYTKI